MEISKKCPECNNPVTGDAPFCPWCGAFLTEKEERGVEEAAGSSVSYSGPRYCPRGHTVEDPSLGFCPDCGSTLVYEQVVYAPRPEADGDSPTLKKRRCPNPKCGYETDDPELVYCPECATPFERSYTPPDPGWDCLCGKHNVSSRTSCISCGKPRGWTPEIPGIMHAPSEEDLNPKEKTYTYGD